MVDVFSSDLLLPKITRSFSPTDFSLKCHLVCLQVVNNPGGVGIQKGI